MGRPSPNGWWSPSDAACAPPPARSTTRARTVKTARTARTCRRKGLSSGKALPRPRRRRRRGAQAPRRTRSPPPHWHSRGSPPAAGSPRTPRRWSAGCGPCASATRSSRTTSTTPRAACGARSVPGRPLAALVSTPGPLKRLVTAVHLLPLVMASHVRLPHPRGPVLSLRGDLSHQTLRVLSHCTSGLGTTHVLMCIGCHRDRQRHFTPHTAFVPGPQLQHCSVA